MQASDRIDSSSLSQVDVTTLLAGMVAIDSVNSAITGKPAAEKPLGDHLFQIAAQLGLVATRLPIEGESFNLLIHSPQVTPDLPWLLFESHMDTVGVASMTIPPFEPAVRDGKLFGRGSCDTKASGAAMLAALHHHHLQSPSAKKHHNVALLFTIDEEIGKTGVSAFVERQLPMLPWKPSGAIVGEPTMLAPITAHNGVVRWSIHTTGQAAHSSDPSRGKSAISMMLRVVDAIETHYVPSLGATHPLTGKAQCSVNVIAGGEQINIIPARCSVQIDRRLVPGESGDTVLPAVQKILDALKREHPQLVVEQGQPFIDPPLDPASGQALHALVAQALTPLGLPTTALGAAYGTDASNFCAAGIPAIVLGPGDIAQAHTADEWIALDQLQQAAKVYLSIMNTPWQEKA